MSEDWRRTGDMDEYAARWSKENSGGEPTKVPRMWVPNIAYGPGRSAAAVSTATWSATDKHALVTVSGGGLIASVVAGASTGCCGRGDGTTAPMASGAKRQWEVVYNGTDNFSEIGVANATFNVSIDNYLGSDSNSISYGADGNILFGNASIGTLATYANGDTIGVACFSNNTIQFNKNGGSFSSTFNISALTGTTFPAYRVVNINASSVTANFTPPLASALLSGFSSFA